MSTLQPNSSLQGGKYKILQSLGQGGFGITYLAIQTGLERKVAIKEFFMKDYCNRDEATSHVSIGSEGSAEMVNRYREKFLKEARNIARLDHPNIVKVIDVFEENGTAYYVMQYAACGSLSDRVKKDGYLSEPVATRYILQIADALDYIHHQKMNHLDVKPANIMLNDKDETVLIDFGLAKQYDAKTGNQTSSTPVGISEGYAPMEQYKQGGVGEFSPETDVYALGATYFKLLTGVTPPSASDINEEGVPVAVLKNKGVSQTAINAIVSAMESRKKDRTKSAREFMDMIENGMEEVAVAVEEESVEITQATSPVVEKVETVKLSENKPASPKPQVIKEIELPKTDSKKWLWIAAGVVAIVAIIFGVSKLVNHNSSRNNDSSGSVDLSTEASYSNGVLSVNGVEYEFVKVEHGTFTMGATSEQANPHDDEEPAHEVTLNKDYYMGKTEVTQALWKAVMGGNPSTFKGDNLPVECVSWDDCQKFIKNLNELTGKKFRLPTEAEWEFAARGGNNSNHYQYSGSNTLGDVAWYCDNSENKTHEVGQKSPNELGIFDMSGNVWEWCSDRYGYYSSGAQTDPTGPNSGPYRVNRGGSWGSFAVDCRSSDRIDYEPDFSNSNLGLRLALSE